MAKVPCVCGCGTMIPPINTNGLAARYAHGHNPAVGGYQPGHRDRRGVEARRALGILAGQGHPNWRGGEWKAGGYVRVTL